MNWESLKREYILKRGEKKMVDEPVTEPADPDPVPFDDEKVWWKSRAIWGSIIAMLSGVISMVTGHVLTPTDQTLLTGDLLNLINAVSSIVTVFAGLWAWYGRVKAKRAISTNIILPVHFRLLGKKEK